MTTIGYCKCGALGSFKLCGSDEWVCTACSGIGLRFPLTDPNQVQIIARASFPDARLAEAVTLLRELGLYLTEVRTRHRPNAQDLYWERVQGLLERCKDVECEDARK